MKLLRGPGPGCAKCAKLMENAKAAAAELGIKAQVEKVTDINAMMGFGVMVTPALVVDGEGKVPSVGKIKGMLT